MWLPVRGEKHGEQNFADFSGSIRLFEGQACLGRVAEYGLMGRRMPEDMDEGRVMISLLWRPPRANHEACP